VRADRVLALGQELVRVHDGLRDELRALQEAVTAGRLPEREGRPLLAHCAAFCSALNRHHTAEDARAFPALAAQFPDLAPLIRKLEEDHQLIGLVVGRVQEAAGRFAASSGKATSRLTGELDGLAAILESHFAFEERRILQALDALRTDKPAAELFGVQVDEWGDRGV
jgi:hemerythrin-like domain-containing protein